MADHPGGRQGRPVLHGPVRHQAAEPSGLGMLTVFEEMFWGDAGIALSILGTGLAAASLAANGTPEQIGEWLPQMFGTLDDPCSPRSAPPNPAPAPTSAPILTRARYDEATDEWVLNGTKTGPPTAASPTSTSSSRRWTPNSAPAGRRRSSSRPAPRASTRARSSRSTASAPRTPPRSCSTTSASPVA